MYSLDINFLNDRAAVPSAPDGGVAQAPVRKITLDELIPAFIGGGIGLIGLGVAAAGFVYINLQTAQYEEQSRILDGELNLLQQQNQKIQQLEQQIQVAQRQRDGLATVFVKILPWSAVLADIRDRIPPGVQVTSVVEKAPEATPAAASAQPAAGQETAAVSAKPMPSLTLSGYADSYDTVNYFFLALGRSLFFNAEKGRIISAKLVDDPNSLEAEGEGQVSLDLPQVVQYTLEIELNDLSEQPPAELATQLESKGAVGSVVRLKNLEQKGLIGPQESN